MSDDEEFDALLRETPARVPPTGFADRVMDARGPEVKLTTWWPRALAAAAVIAAAALMWPQENASGELVARVRTTVSLGDRGVAVAEPEAALVWLVSGDEARVEQRAGQVFYRVDGGGPFVVRTPAGDVRALGTCFTVEVETMVNGSHVKGALAGAALTAVAFVAVHEGEVTVANAHGEAKVVAGQRARATADAPPKAVPRTQPTRRHVRAPRTALPPLVATGTPTAPEPPSSPATEATVEQAAALEAQVAKLTARLATEKAMRVETEGHAVEFPEDLPQDFTEEALLANFKAAFTELGRDFEITSIDCSEYPCVVYGDVENEDDRALDGLGETQAFKPYRDHGDVSNSTSAWGRKVTDDEGGDYKRTFFGLAIYPNEKDAERRGLIGKRLRFRNQQAIEAMGSEE